jgi:hypothetical protein
MSFGEPYPTQQHSPTPAIADAPPSPPPRSLCASCHLKSGELEARPKIACYLCMVVKKWFLDMMQRSNRFGNKAQHC